MHTYAQAHKHTALACFLPGFQLNSCAENEALKKKEKKKEYNDKPEVQTGFQLQYQEHFQMSTRNDVIEKQKLQSSMMFFSYVGYSNSPKKWELISLKTTPEKLSPLRAKENIKTYHFQVD